MHNEAETAQGLRRPRKPRWSGLRNSLEGHKQATSEAIEWNIVEAMIYQVWKYMWRPKSSILRGSPGGCNQASLEAIIKRVCRCTRRLCLIQIELLFGGGQVEGSRLNGRRRRILKLHFSSTLICENVECWVQQGPPSDDRWEIREWLGAGE